MDDGLNILLCDELVLRTLLGLSIAGLLTPPTYIHIRHNALPVILLLDSDFYMRWALHSIDGIAAVFRSKLRLSGYEG